MMTAIGCQIRGFMSELRSRLLGASRVLVHVSLAVLLAEVAVPTNANCQFIPVTITDEEVEQHVLGALAYLRDTDPESWGGPEQQRATAVAILQAIDTAHSRGLGLIANQPLEAQVAAFRSPEFQSIVEGMPESTTHELASKLTAKLIMGDSGGSLRRRILDAQNEDGSWGLEPGRVGNQLDTSIAILSLVGVRQLDVPTDSCLAAAEYLNGTFQAAASPERFTVDDSPNPHFGPLWPLSAEKDGESHIVHAAYGLHALRLINQRISNNSSRTVMNVARGYIGSATDSSAPANTVEDNALAFMAILGLQLWGNPREPIRAILDTDSPAIPHAWPNEAGVLDAYTTALAARALAMWLPEQNAGKPDLTTRPADLIVDTATNKLRVLYRNQGETPAAASESFTVGQVFLESEGPSLAHSAQFVSEDSYVESTDQLTLATVGPGAEPIAVTVHLDPGSVINEADESNNIVTYPLSRDRLGLDLTILPEDVWFEDDPGSSGWLVHATFRAIGRGILPTDTLTFELRSSHTNANSNSFFPDGGSPMYTLNDDRLVEVTWLDSTPPTQLRYYRVKVTSSQECSSCGTNNQVIVAVTPSAVNDAHNIEISDSTATPSSPGVETTISLEVNGVASFPASQPPTVSFKVYDAGNLQTPIASLTGFQVGSTWSATIPDIELPPQTLSFNESGAPEAMTTLLVHADADSVFAESNEGDNWHTVKIHYNRFDLSLDESSFTLSNTDLGYSPEVEVSVGLRNAGPLPVSLESTIVDFSIEYSPEVGSPPVTDVFASVAPGDLELEFGEGLHLSAVLTPPVGEVTIRAEIKYHNGAGGQEIWLENNSVAREVTFTRETLTIALIPASTDGHYSAGDQSVRNYEGIISILSHSAPSGSPLDPTDGVTVTYKASLGPVNANSEELVELSPANGEQGRFRIPIQYLRAQSPGEYVIHGTAYEDGRLASTATESFEINEFQSQSVSASIVPAGEPLGADDAAAELGGESGEPSLFITLSSTGNTPRTYDYRAVLERYDEVTSDFVTMSNPSNGIDVVNGSFAFNELGTLVRRDAIVIPSTGVFVQALPEGLYRMHVTVTASETTEPLLCQDWAGFRVAKPDDYILLEKTYRVDGEVVTQLRPIEGQEVQVTLTLERE